RPPVRIWDAIDMQEVGNCGVPDVFDGVAVLDQAHGPALVVGIRLNQLLSLPLVEGAQQTLVEEHFHPSALAPWPGPASTWVLAVERSGGIHRFGVENSKGGPRLRRLSDAVLHSPAAESVVGPLTTGATKVLALVGKHSVQSVSLTELERQW